MIFLHIMYIRDCVCSERESFWSIVHTIYMIILHVCTLDRMRMQLRESLIYCAYYIHDNSTYVHWTDCVCIERESFWSIVHILYMIILHVCTLDRMRMQFRGKFLVYDVHVYCDIYYIIFVKDNCSFIEGNVCLMTYCRIAGVYFSWSKQISIINP